MIVNISQFILYACPVGDLAAQLDRFFRVSKERCGSNAAHSYMPHCTLTGFFQDDAGAVPHYCQTLDQVMAAGLMSHPASVSPVTITQMTFCPNWYGLELESDLLKHLTQQFAQRERSPTRREPLRLKEWLHLSLAYGFQPDQSDTLKQLALDLVDWQAPVAWELRFYQRLADQRWMCHQAWPLG